LARRWRGTSRRTGRRASPPPGGIGPTPLPPIDNPAPPVPDPDCIGGSIIECQNSTLAEQVPLYGTPYALRYQSDRAPGRATSLTIPLTDATWNTATKPLRVDVNITIAGVSTDFSFPASTLVASQSFTWPWNRLDAYGNVMQGLQEAVVSVNYVYQSYFATDIPPDMLHSTFGMVAANGTPYNLTYNRGADTIAVGTTNLIRIGIQDPEPQGLGGWTVSVNHLYDPESQTLWGGDGSRSVVTPAAMQIDTVQGTKILSGAGQVSRPAVASDGSTYFINSSQVLQKVSPQGVVSTIAGGGSDQCPVAPGENALHFALTNVDSLTVAPNGLIYEAGERCVNVIDPVKGTIQTIAGTGQDGPTGASENAVALDGRFGGSLLGIAVAPDGSVYVVDQTAGLLQRIGTDGSLSSVTALSAAAPNSNNYQTSSLASAQYLHLTTPSGVAVGPDGTIYVSDTYLNTRITRIDPRSGVATLFAGGIAASIVTPFNNDGRSRALLPLNSAQASLAAGPDGSVYVTSTYGDGELIWRIDPLGIAHLLAGGGTCANLGASEGDAAAALNSCLTFGSGDQGLSLSPDGSLVFADSGYTLSTSRIRRVHSSFPGYQPGTLVTTIIPSQDGRELYGFDTSGRHLYTYDATSGATILTFNYVGATAQLNSIVDSRMGAVNNTTSFSYAAGLATITAPLGQETKLGLDGSAEAAYPHGPGRATSITFPNTVESEVNYYTYTNGLMSGFTDAKSQHHTFSYDAVGQLIQDQDPTGASKLLNRVPLLTPVSPDGGAEPGQSWTSVITGGTGARTTHVVQTLSSGGTNYIDVSPSGASRSYAHNTSDTRTTTAADGTVTTVTTSADPQYGMLDPNPTSTKVVVPSGPTSQTTYSRIVNPAMVPGSPPVLSPTSIVDTTTRGPATGPGQITTVSTYSSIGTGLGGTRTITSTLALTGSTLSRSIQETLDSFGRVTQSFPANCSGTTCTVADVPSTSTPMASTTMAYAGPLGALSSRYFGSRLWTYGHDSYGNLSSVTPPVTDEEIQFDGYDGDGRLTHVTLPDSNVYSKTYDKNGNVASISVPSATTPAPTHSFAYTGVDLLQTYKPPQVAPADGGIEPQLATLNTSYTYDGEHNLLNTVAPEGATSVTMNNIFDVFGRLSSRYDPLSAVTTTFGYDTADRLSTVTTSDGIVVTNGYAGALKASTMWSGGLFSSAQTVHWTYDSFLRPSTLTVNSGHPITLSYVDPDGLFTGATSSDTDGTFAVTRDLATGMATSATIGSVTESWTYDAFGAPTTFTATTGTTVPPTTLYSMSISSRDNEGRILDMTENNHGTSHTWSSVTYDNRGRLSSLTLDSVARSFGYDANGNLTTYNGATAGTYDEQDRLLSMHIGFVTNTPTYTNNGDTASAGGYNYTYDLQRNLRSASEPVYNNIQYAIDGMNRRVGKSITQPYAPVLKEGLLYDESGRVVAELAGSPLAVVSTFVYGLKPNVPDYMIRGGKAYAIISDWRGSVREVVDATTNPATVIESIDYDEWGNVTNLADSTCTTSLCLYFQPFGFAGGIYEPSIEIVRFGARDYIPRLMRWMQKDPIRFGGGQENLYVYVNDDPINGSDPNGQWGTIAECLQGVSAGATSCGNACYSTWNKVCAFFGSTAISDCLNACTNWVQRATDTCFKGVECTTEECWAMK
jgi:RHS repeat-associated protein